MNCKRLVDSKLLDAGSNSAIYKAKQLVYPFTPVYCGIIALGAGLDANTQLGFVCIQCSLLVGQTHPLESCLNSLHPPHSTHLSFHPPLIPPTSHFPHLSLHPPPIPSISHSIHLSLHPPLIPSTSPFFIQSQCSSVCKCDLTPTESLQYLTTHLDGCLALESIILGRGHQEARHHLLKVPTQLTLNIITQILHTQKNTYKMIYPQDHGRKVKFLNLLYMKDRAKSHIYFLCLQVIKLGSVLCQ